MRTVRAVLSSKSGLVESFIGNEGRCWLSASLGQLLVCIFIVGCGGGVEQDEEESNLRPLAAYYGQYQAQNRGQVPANEQDFKDYIAKGGVNTSVDSLFTSKRDGKPYVIKYRGDKAWRLPGYFAYEQEGRDGIREAATVVGGYERLSVEKFNEKMATTAVKR